jgi:phosphatidylinositol-3-phosphatase
MWAEAGTNFGVHNDHDPYAETGGTNQDTREHLSSYLTAMGKNWKSYQEDIDLIQDDSGQRTNTPSPEDRWTVPLTSFSGVFATGVNAFNGSTQYNYAAKHNPMVFRIAVAHHDQPRVEITCARTLVGETPPFHRWPSAR